MSPFWFDMLTARCTHGDSTKASHAPISAAGQTQAGYSGALLRSQGPLMAWQSVRLSHGRPSCMGRGPA